MDVTEDPQVTVFISYSHKDERFKEALEEHLAVLRRAKKISHWSDRKIVAGSSWAAEIDRNIETADVILLLVSPSFVASGYCYEKELARALKRHEAESAVVIPVFVRPLDLIDEPLMGLQGLPKDAISIIEWQNEDLGWRDVARGLRVVIDELLERKRRYHEPSGFSTLQETLAEMVESLDRRDKSGPISGISFGLHDVDHLTDGIHAGQLITIASRPSMGKTNLALGIVSSVAVSGLPVLVFSTKTPRRDVMNRLITITGRVSHTRFQVGRLNDDDWPRVTHAVHQLAEAQILFDDSTDLAFSALRERCISAKRKLGALGLVVVDSVSYIKVSSETGAHEEVIARGLKALARELDCAVLVTAPVSRTVEIRPNKRPNSPDLQNWRELADESDLVAFVYRDEFYNFDSPDRGTAELIIAKNQYGQVGPVRLVFAPEYGTFSDLTFNP
ncbi:DnaB-like helicase C-terminal domain-containing protein [Paraburkholderia unamae]|uniref:TIR domain-containing protein n=1 Tax=Paraburkholderia unamae TaxID=219649 RepID=A0ABX5KNJ3_9BURK|nr:DnaB-like helicase C-terminal domain-containing protein [Paraburkholderia unamae]PVX82456.1 TIR domain-containing protein [Paraburkholderia unamae]